VDKPQLPNPEHLRRCGCTPDQYSQLLEMGRKNRARLSYKIRTSIPWQLKPSIVIQKNVSWMRLKIMPMNTIRFSGDEFHYEKRIVAGPLLVFVRWFPRGDWCWK
jgi:hypothetical protein